MAQGISFIKCDVEERELRCVKGATCIIKNSKPAWLIEVSGDPDDPGSMAHEIFRLLNQEGYEAFWFDGKSPKKRSTGDEMSTISSCQRNICGRYEKNLMNLGESASSIDQKRMSSVGLVPSYILASFVKRPDTMLYLPFSRAI